MSDKLNDISRAIGRLEGKVDGICQRLDSLPCSAQSKKIDDLETFRDEMIGKTTIFGAIAGFIGAIVVSIISWLIKDLKN